MNGLQVTMCSMSFCQLRRLVQEKGKKTVVCSPLISSQSTPNTQRPPGNWALRQPQKCPLSLLFPSFPFSPSLIPPPLPSSISLSLRKWRNHVPWRTPISFPGFTHLLRALKGSRWQKNELKSQPNLIEIKPSLSLALPGILRHSTSRCLAN